MLLILNPAEAFFFDAVDDFVSAFGDDAAVVNDVNEIRVDFLQNFPMVRNNNGGFFAVQIFL